LYTIAIAEVKKTHAYLDLVERGLRYCFVLICFICVNFICSSSYVYLP